LRDNFLQRVGDRTVDYIADYMGPFFVRVAGNIREVNPDWILFAELDPLSGFSARAFPIRRRRTPSTRIIGKTSRRWGRKPSIPISASI